MLQHGFVVSFTTSANLLTLPRKKGRQIYSHVCQSMAAPTANSGRSGAPLLVTSEQTSILSRGWWWTAGVATSVTWFACAHQALCTYKPWRVRHNAIGLAQALTMLPLQWAVFNALIGSPVAKKSKAASSVERRGSDVERSVHLGHGAHCRSSDLPPRPPISRCGDASLDRRPLPRRVVSRICQPSQRHSKGYQKQVDL